MGALGQFRWNDTAFAIGSSGWRKKTKSLYWEESRQA
jgi:hypothetical protein